MTNIYNDKKTISNLSKNLNSIIFNRLMVGSLNSVISSDYEILKATDQSRTIKNTTSVIVLAMNIPMDAFCLFCKKG